MSKIAVDGVLVSAHLFKAEVRTKLPPTDKSQYVVLSLESLRAMVQQLRKAGADFRVNAAGEGDGP